MITIILTACVQAPVTKKENALPIEELEAEITSSENKGLTLFNTVEANGINSKPTSRQADLIEMSGELRCHGKYSAYEVIDDEKQIENIYLLLIPPKSSGLQFGRHLKFEFKLGTNNMISTTYSTKTCLLIPSTSEPGSSAFVTHLLSPVPSEYHVFLSLYHSQTIFVSTSEGLWKIQAGRIGKMDTSK